MIVKTVVVGDIDTNCYIFGCEKTMEGAIVDPGDWGADIIREVAQSKLRIKYIFITHGHSDHILALDEVKAATGAKVVISKEEAPRLMRSRYISPTEADVIANEGDVFGVGTLSCKWLITPGHTSGSSCILVDDVLFSGDTLFYNNCGRCDLPTGNYDAMLVSLKRLALLAGDYTVYPGHGPSSTMAFERANNPYMAEGVKRK